MNAHNFGKFDRNFFYVSAFRVKNDKKNPTAEQVNAYIAVQSIPNSKTIDDFKGTTKIGKTEKASSSVRLQMLVLITCADTFGLQQLQLVYDRLRCIYRCSYLSTSGFEGSNISADLKLSTTIVIACLFSIMIYSASFSDSNFVVVNYTLFPIQSSCKYYDNVNKVWKMDGTEVGPNTTKDVTHCRVYHLTSFSSAFDVPMNSVNLQDSAFLHLAENPIAFVFCMCLFCLYLILAVWCRRKDKEDLKKVKYIASK